MVMQTPVRELPMSFRLIFIAVVAVMGCAPGAPALADFYPTHPITVIVPFAAGAPVDSVGRLVAERMGRALGQPIIMENVSGAAGSLGVARAARANPDGYTLSLGNVSSHVLNAALYKLPFDVLEFEPIALVATNPQIIVSKKTLPATDLKGLIAWLKANPDKATVGTGGIGGIAHVSGALFAKMTETKLNFVPYRGTNLAQQDLVAGQIDLLLDQAVNAIGQVQTGAIRAYAVTADTRLASAPDIPTVDEAGLPGFYVSVWNAFWVPKGTPKEIIAKLNSAAREALADPATLARLNALGLDIPSPDQQSPEALGALHRSEVAKWWPIVREANIQGR